MIHLQTDATHLEIISSMIECKLCLNDRPNDEEICPHCGADKLPKDYEPCGECGFDHEYEAQSANATHSRMEVDDD